MQNKDLLIVIEENMPSFSKGQKRIGNYLLAHYEKAVLLTAAKLGAKVEVSESTVVRFAIEVGYNGYPEFQDALKEAVKNKLTSRQRMELTTDFYIREGKEILPQVLKSDIEKLNATINNIDTELFENVVESIASAKKVYIVAGRSSGALASYFSYYLNMVHNDVIKIESGFAGEVFEQIFRISEGDVLIGISFPRYSLSTVKAMEYAHNKKATTISITDNASSPLAKHGKYNLVTKTGMVSFIDSIVAPLSVISAILIAISVQKKDELYSNFELLEKIWEDNKVYSLDLDQTDNI